MPHKRHATWSEMRFSTAFTVLALIVSFMAWDVTRTLPPLPTEPALQNATSPFGNVTVNATALQLACDTLCGAAGSECSYTATSVPTCVTCGQGEGWVPVPGGCAHIAMCITVPWCSNASATVVLDKHNALVALALNTTTGVATYPYPGNTTDIDLLNLYLGEKKALLDAGRRADTPIGFFNDERGWWGSNLPFYLSALNASSYAPYVTGLKASVCTQTWVADTATGKCESPSPPSPS